MRQVPVRALLALACGLVTLAYAPAQTIREFQPAIKWHGRAVAVTIDPADTRRAIVASESGGLFMTENGGVTWSHLDNLPMFRMRDVKYGPLVPGGGRLVIATGPADSRTINQGGIWRSTDGGNTWSKPADSNPGCSGRAGAYGIAFEPGGANVYVGTDCGLALSTDYGATWSHLNPNPGNRRILSVVSQAGGIVDICGDGGHQRSVTAGGVFDAVTPGSMAGAGPHCLAASPVESGVIYVANAIWVPKGSYCGKDNAGWAAALFEGVYGPGGGITWRTAFLRRCNTGRPAWVATHLSRDGNSDHFDIYFGTGLEVFRQTVTTKGGSGPRCGPLSWTAVTVDHADQSELAFSTENNCAQFLVSDGGIHQPTDAGDPANCGATWEIVGPPDNGYHALQLYQVTGQIINGPSEAHLDLYIGTQDNGLWASDNGGLTWPFPTGGEGFVIQVPRYATSHSSQKVTWCDTGQEVVNRAGPAHFEADAPWNNPPGANIIDNPILIRQRPSGLNVYVQYREFSIGKILAITRDSGGSWNDVTLNPLTLEDWCQVSIAGDDYNAVLYQPYKRPGWLPGREDRIGLLKIGGIHIDGTVSGAKIRLADGGGLGSIGKFALGEGTFLLPVVFAVDPYDPTHLIAADVEWSEMKVSTDGGASWNPDSQLTDLVEGLDAATGRREFRFDIGANEYPRSVVNPGTHVQAHVIAFDPFHRGHILVGTEAAGIFRSTNNGATWSALPDSRKVTAVSSIFFVDENSPDNTNPGALIATYGRGLWKVTFDTEFSLPFNVPPEEIERWGGCWLRAPAGACLAPQDLFPSNACPACLYDVVLDGRITDILTASNGAVEAIAIDGGRLVSSTQGGQQVTPTIPILISPQPGSFNGCPECASLVQQGGAIRGVVLQRGQLRAIIGGFGPLPPENWLRQFAPPPGQEAPTPDATPPSEPYLQLRGAVATGGGPTVPVGGSVLAVGSGFCAEAGCSPVTITVGDRVATNGLIVDANGSFQAQLAVAELPGVYLVTAMQQGLNGAVLADAASVLVAVGEAEATEQGPRLTIRRQGNGLVLAWPSTNQTYFVEWTSDLANSEAWQEYPAPVNVIGDENVVFVQPVGIQTFFRLQR